MANKKKNSKQNPINTNKPPVAGTKYALKQVWRDPETRMAYVYYVDANSGAVLLDLTGYKLWEAGVVTDPFKPNPNSTTPPTNTPTGTPVGTTEVPKTEGAWNNTERYLGRSEDREGLFGSVKSSGFANSSINNVGQTPLSGYSNPPSNQSVTPEVFQDNIGDVGARTYSNPERYYDRPDQMEQGDTGDDLQNASANYSFTQAPVGNVNSRSLNTGPTGTGRVGNIAAQNWNTNDVIGNAKSMQTTEPAPAGKISAIDLYETTKDFVSNRYPEYTPVQVERLASAVVGNSVVETGAQGTGLLDLDNTHTDAKNSKTNVGIASWQGNRVPQDLSLEGQLNHLFDELDNGWSGASQTRANAIRDAIANASTNSIAAELYSVEYEVANPMHNDQRMAYAEAAAKGKWDVIGRAAGIPSTAIASTDNVPTRMEKSIAEELGATGFSNVTNLTPERTVQGVPTGMDISKSLSRQGAIADQNELSFSGRSGRVPTYDDNSSRGFVGPALDYSKPNDGYYKSDLGMGKGSLLDPNKTGYSLSPMPVSRSELANGFVSTGNTGAPKSAVDAYLGNAGRYNTPYSDTNKPAGVARGFNPNMYTEGRKFPDLPEDMSLAMEGTRQGKNYGSLWEAVKDKFGVSTPPSGLPTPQAPSNAVARDVYAGARKDTAFNPQGYISPTVQQSLTGTGSLPYTPVASFAQPQIAGIDLGKVAEGLARGFASAATSIGTGRTEAVNGGLGISGRQNENPFSGVGMRSVEGLGGIGFDYGSGGRSTGLGGRAVGTSGYNGTRGDSPSERGPGPGGTVSSGTGRGGNEGAYTGAGKDAGLGGTSSTSSPSSSFSGGGRTPSAPSRGGNEGSYGSKDSGLGGSSSTSNSGGGYFGGGGYTNSNSFGGPR